MQEIILPGAPKMSPERKKIVDAIIAKMQEEKPTYQEAYDILNDVQKELYYRSLFVHL
ncbi:hypothetical protein D3C74_158390 [compost metagenome]